MKSFILATMLALLIVNTSCLENVRVFRSFADQLGLSTYLSVEDFLLLSLVKAVSFALITSNMDPQFSRR